MEQRAIWNEYAAGIQHMFEDALQLGQEAAQLFGDYANVSEPIQVLAKHRDNWLQNRFEIVVVGEFSTGKSTFINTLLRKEVLPSKVLPTTATINYIRHIEHGDGREIAIIHFRDGRTSEVEFQELDTYVTEMSKQFRVAYEVAYVDVFVESPYLNDGVVIVDTPGLQALNPEHERITKEQIKQSNASIFLFNLEQPGKRTEYEFLQYLKGSIDRIFFVGNRMDGVPADELSEVIHSIEHALQHNDYVRVPAKQAKLYAISAKQALKARDPNFQTEEWRDWSSDNLIEASQFEQFEERLETYLFQGEKVKDLLKTPIHAITHFYRELERQMEQIGVLVSGEIDTRQLSAEKERLFQEVELRRLQLQDKERSVQGRLDDAIYQHEKYFNERRVHVQQQYIERVDEIIFTEELEDGVNALLMDLNQDLEKLIDSSLVELGQLVENAMKREIYNFELHIQPEGQGRAILKLAEYELSVSKLNVRPSSFVEEIDQRYEEKKQQLLEERKLLLHRIQMEQELASAEENRKLVMEQQKSENRFHEMLLNNTGPTKKQYGVLKERKWWFNKMGMLDVENERYYELINEKKKLMKEHEEEKLGALLEVEEKKHQLSGSDTEFMSMKDWYDARRELLKRKEEERMAKLREMTQSETRQLEREKKQVKRQLESIFEDVRRGYRTLLRELDALKLAKSHIEQYIQDKDHEFKQKLQELEAKERLLLENETKQQEYKARVGIVSGKIDAQMSALADLHLHLV